MINVVMKKEAESQGQQMFVVSHVYTSVVHNHLVMVTRIKS